MSWKDGSHYKGDWKGGVPHGIGNRDNIKAHLSSMDNLLVQVYTRIIY